MSRVVGNVPFFALEDTSSNSSTFSASNKSTNSTIDYNNKKKRGKNKEWTFVKEFESALDAESIRKSEDWCYSYRGKTIEGEYVVLRCNKSKQKLSTARKQKRDDKLAAKRQRLEEEVENFISEKLDEVDSVEQCLRNVKLLYKSDSQKVLMYETADEHGFHNTLTEMNIEITKKIKHLFDSGVTRPCSIIHQLRQDNPDNVPSRRQVYYEIVKIKEERFGVPGKI